MLCLFRKLITLLQISPSNILEKQVRLKIVPANTVTTNSLSLPEDMLLSTSLPLKLHLSNLFNLISVDTKNFFTV